MYNIYIYIYTHTHTHTSNLIHEFPNLKTTQGNFYLNSHLNKVERKEPEVKS